jgi:carboxylesterase type B
MVGLETRGKLSGSVRRTGLTRSGSTAVTTADAEASRASRSSKVRLFQEGGHRAYRCAQDNCAAWVSFATRGDPGWSKHDLVRRATMRFDTTSQVLDDPRSMERKLWEGVR